MNVNSRFIHPKLLDDLQAKQDLVRNFLKINPRQSQVKEVVMDSDGEDELVDIGLKVEPVKVSEVIAAKVSPNFFSFFRQLINFVTRPLKKRLVVRNLLQKISRSQHLFSTTKGTTFCSLSLRNSWSNRSKSQLFLRRRWWVGGTRFMPWTLSPKCLKESMDTLTLLGGSGN